MRRALDDRRSGRVVLLSHCLLNQNTRYLGGATCPGVVEAAVSPYIRDGVGIVQLPCPEQRVWGGVLKRRLLWLVEHPRTARAAAPLFRLAAPYLRWQYARIARAVARDVADYSASGFEVVGVVGVAGSPSCGVTSTLDLPTSLAALGCCPHRTVTSSWMNDEVVAPALRPGRGLFIGELADQLSRRGLELPLTEHTLS